MISKKSLRFLALLLHVGCLTSAFADNKSSTDLTLKNVYQFRPGKTLNTDVQEKMGAPQRELFSDGEIVLSEPSLYKIWEYHRKVKVSTATGEIEESLPKVTFSFEAKTGTLQRVNWHVGDDEPEQDLNIAKSKFKSANFLRREAEQVCSHYFPDEVFFEDKKLGLSITWRKTRKEVESISWGIPSTTRSVAEKSSKTRPKIDCSIGG